MRRRTAAAVARCRRWAPADAREGAWARTIASLRGKPNCVLRQALANRSAGWRFQLQDPAWGRRYTCQTPLLPASGRRSCPPNDLDPFKRVNHEVLRSPPTDTAARGHHDGRLFGDGLDHRTIGSTAP